MDLRRFEGGSIPVDGVGLGQRSSMLDVVSYQRVLRKEIQGFPVLPLRNKYPGFKLRKERKTRITQTSVCC